MMLVEERKIPFDQNAQAEYFLRYDQDKLDLQKLVKATNDDSQRKSVESKKVAEEIFDRLINQTILLIAVSCGIANEDCAKLKGLIITTDIGDSGNILVVRKFKGYIHYSSLKRVAKEMVNIEVESGTAKRVVTLDWITSLTGVRGAEASSLLEALLAFEIIKLSNYFPLIYFAQDLDTALQINHNFSMMDNISN
ncbi:hypothetical protein CSQ90_26110 [Janthinobacterium sp. BJB303]|nr:hypothetical protein CSQ90_26110 [Janthinobacterium sp. BJB303]